MITDDQLKEWRELADKAMPGPWMEMERCDDAPPGESCGVVSGLVAAHGGAVDVFASDAYDECSHPVTTADAAFIAAARTAVPALIDEVERLRANNGELRQGLDMAYGPHCSSCGNAIDPDTCHCGADMNGHSMGDGHCRVPMGCICGYAPDWRALAKSRGEMVYRLRAELARLRPVYEAAVEWVHAEHTYDSNCAAGEHDDCPARPAQSRLRAAIDAAEAKEQKP